MLKAYPEPDARVPERHEQRDHQQREPAGPAQGQHPARLPAEREQPVQLSLRQVQLGGDRRVPRRRSLRAHRLGSSEHDADGELDEHAPEQHRQRGDLHLRARPGLHQRPRERPLQAQHLRHHLSVPVPAEQGDRRQAPDHLDRRLRPDRRRAVSLVVGRADPDLREHDDVGQEPAHDQGRRVVRVLGRGRLRPDQRPADSRQHQQPERPLRVRQQHHGALGPGHVGRRAGPLHQLRRDRPARLHAVARPVDRRLRAGLVAADEQDHGRRRPPLRALAAVALADQQHRDVRPGVLRQEQHGDRESRDRRDHRRAALQRHHPAGRRVPLVGEQPRRL